MSCTNEDHSYEEEFPNPRHGYAHYRKAHNDPFLEYEEFHAIFYDTEV